ncbi:MAG: NAD(P)H-binding protein [Thermoplasmata archaeon]|nr:NAD(P)H-binding protein [Thermoplasmata archaeon]
MRTGSEGPRLLLVGGGGGLAGRAITSELAHDHWIRSLHRHPSPTERERGVEWIPGDIAGEVAWTKHLSGVGAVVNVAWNRHGAEATFRGLHDGLLRLLDACDREGVQRFVQISVPPSTPHLETTLPYLVWKRRFDKALERSGISYAILRPSALFGRGDVLLGVMLRLIRRYRVFPMFGDGRFHLSPLSATDLARAVRRALLSEERSTIDLGGPDRFCYRELTDLMFAVLGRRPHYVPLSPTGSLRLARWFERLGSPLLYEYEVEWLLSDRLGLTAYEGLERPLERVEPYLREVALHPRRSAAG